jgi:hypothetical protein
MREPERVPERVAEASDSGAMYERVPLSSFLRPNACAIPKSSTFT